MASGYQFLRVEESRPGARPEPNSTPDPVVVLRRELSGLKSRYTQLEADARRAFKDRDEMKAALDSQDAAGHFRRELRKAIGRETQLRAQVTAEKEKTLQFGEKVSVQRQTIEQARKGLWELWSDLDDGPVKTRLWEVWSELA